MMLKNGKKRFLRKLKKEKLRAYFADYHKFIENLLAKDGSTIRLAVLSDDHDVVLGFSVSREDVLDYVHVQMDNRKLGIAKMLVPSRTTTVTHMTNLATGIWQENPNYKHIKFNPYA